MRPRSSQTRFRGNHRDWTHRSTWLIIAVCIVGCAGMRGRNSQRGKKARNQGPRSDGSRHRHRLRIPARNRKPDGQPAT